MKRYSRIQLLGLITSLLGILYSCTKQDYFYKEFVDTRIKHYAGKADSAKALAGDNRVRLAWLITDPLIDGAVIYWNQKKDSLVVSHPLGIDSWEADIEGLAETTHTFVIVTKDKNGNRSIPVQVSGASFGDKFRATLFNRSINNLVFANGVLTIYWNPESAEHAVGTEINYVDSQGANRTLTFPMDQTVTQLEGFKPGTTFTYRTGFKPATHAVDTFYSDLNSLKPELEELLDWSKFAEVRLPTDTYQQHPSLLTSMDKMWNDDITSTSNLFLTVPGLSPIPQWFTFDLGAPASVSRMRLWHRATWYYNLGNLKHFEVYGSNQPNPDGSWESWVKIGEFHSHKPSGLPLGQTNQQDLDYILAGEEFVFEKNLPAYRYLRIKTLEVWGTVEYVCIQKMQIWSNIE